MKQIFVVGSSIGYANWINGHNFVKKVEDADFVLFTGGEDVSPKLYGGESGNSFCYSNLARDLFEKQMFEEAIKLNKKMLGICRGSQFLCVMAGGKLVQDCSNHAGSNHKIVSLSDENDFLQVNSLHHQMMHPFNLSQDDYECIYKAQNNNTGGFQTSYFVLNGKKYIVPNDIELPYEPEVVYFKKIKALAIQCHPEMMFSSLKKRGVIWEENISGTLNNLTIEETLYKFNKLIDTLFYDEM